MHPHSTIATLPACALLALLTACSGEPDNGVILVPPDPNYTEREPPVFEAPPPVEVALPTPPDLGPLEGWKPPESCAPGKMPRIGETECQWIGTPCPAGSDAGTVWPAELPEGALTNGALRYVTPKGTGDGLSKSAAMGSIQQAVNEVADGGTVVLSTGRFVENITIDRPVNLQGVCARDTILEAAGAMPEQTLARDENNTPLLDENFRASAATLRLTGLHARFIQDLQITGKRIGLLAEQGEIDLTGIWIAEVQVYGLLGYAGSGSLTIHAEGLATTDVRSSPEHAASGFLGLPAFPYGVGIGINQLRDPTITMNSSLKRVWIARTGMDSLHIRGLRNQTGTSSEHRLENLVSESAGQDTRDSDGIGFLGVSANLERIYVRRTAGLSSLWCRNCQIAGKQVLIEEVEATSGIWIWDQGQVGQRSQVRLSDLRIRNVSPPVAVHGALALGDTEFGFGITLFGGLLELTRAEVDRATTAGLIAYESKFFCANSDARACGGSDLRIEDVKVTRTQPDSMGRYGMGLASTDGANLTAARVLIEQNHSAGILIANDFRPIDGTETEESRAILSDITVTGTRKSLGVNDIEFGDGIAVVNGAATQVERFDIHDNARVGLLVGGTSDFRQASAFFKDGNVTGHVIGVSVASGWMDLDRDFDNVSAYDNQVNLSSSEISLPSMSILPGGG